MVKRVAIQGEPGSACEMAAPKLWSNRTEAFDPVYLSSAQDVVELLRSSNVDLAVFALESPVGTDVNETVQALKALSKFQVINSCCLPVNHVVLTRSRIPRCHIEKIFSHPVPLAKHAAYLRAHYYNAALKEVEDTGTAARKLAKGEYGEAAAVVAMPTAAQLFGLNIDCRVLPGNQDYMTRFVLIQATSHNEANSIENCQEMFAME